MHRHVVRLPLLVVVGRTVREVRIKAGWSQRELSRRSGVPQAEICRIECGQTEDLRIGTIDRLFGALGIRYWLQIEAPRAIRPQADLVHARCSAYVTRRLTASGWLVEREVEIGNDRGRGWIDILAFHPGLGILLVIEVKTEIHDVGDIERTMNWYQREAARAAHRFGWRATAVASALLVLQSQANDDLIVRSSDVFRTAFPGRARMLEAVVTGAGEHIDQRHLAMIDPRSRRSGWLRSTRSDGRRSASPYVDYIDAARLLDPSTVGCRPR
jgi:transcriptional regulator with XRE-family HTH domain